jgi:hypothetical protein
VYWTNQTDISRHFRKVCILLSVIATQKALSNTKTHLHDPHGNSMWSFHLTADGWQVCQVFHDRVQSFHRQAPLLCLMSPDPTMPAHMLA